MQIFSLRYAIENAIWVCQCQCLCQCLYISKIQYVHLVGCIMSSLWVLQDMSSFINSSPLSAAYMHWSTWSPLVQVMACRLFGTKPLPEPMLTYSQLDSWEYISVKFESQFYHFHSRKCIWKCRLPKWWPFCPGGDGVIPLASCFNPLYVSTCYCGGQSFLWILMKPHDSWSLVSARIYHRGVWHHFNIKALRGRVLW